MKFFTEKMQFSKHGKDAAGMEQQNKDIPEKEEDNTQLEEEEEENYPSLKIVIPTILCVYMAVFLTALDRTIVGVAVPAISNEFHSFGDISWYESAFLLTFCVFQLPMGKIYKFFSAKWTFITIVMIFEVASIVCATAPSSTVFIVGRAITGIGGAGTFVGGQVIIRNLVPLAKRPKYLGFVGAVFGLASIMGPLVGGAFTSNVSWRWCFWFNVPIGGVALLGFFFILPDMPPPDKIEGKFWENLKRFDPIGNLLVAPGLICIILGTQWGGTTYPWSDGRVIALLVVGSVLLVSFAIVQCWVQENGTIPPRIFCQRSIAACTFVSLGVGSAMVILAFYLPIWFQAIQDLSAGSAGARLLAFFLSTVFCVIGSGIAISKLGYYTPFLIAGSAVFIVGTALLTTFRVDTSTGKWVGYEIIVGAGLGLCLQQSANAAQTVLSKKDVPTGITILAFAQQFGGTIFVTVSQTILTNTLSTQLAATLPGFDTSKLSTTGATNIRNLVPKDELPIVLTAYNKGINNVFYVALGLACLTFVASLFVEWKTVRPKNAESDASAKA